MRPVVCWLWLEECSTNTWGRWGSKKGFPVVYTLQELLLDVFSIVNTPLRPREITAVLTVKLSLPLKEAQSREKEG